MSLLLVKKGANPNAFLSSSKGSPHGGGGGGGALLCKNLRKPSW